MRKLSFLVVAAVTTVLCAAANAQGGVVIRPSGPCGPTVPGDMMVLYNTMSRIVTVYVTQLSNGTAKQLNFDMRPNTQQELGCSVHGLAQQTWVIKGVKQPDPLPGRR